MEHLFGAIPSVLKGLETNPDIDEAVVFAAWTGCAGELLKARTVPQSFANKRLVVGVQDATWKRNLEELSPQMMAKLNNSMGNGTVKFIEFRIDPKMTTRHIELACRQEDGSEKPTASPSILAAAASIADEQLRSQFLEAAAVYLAKQTS